MARHERRARMRALRQRGEANGVDRWAESFLEALRTVAAPTATVEAPSRPDEVIAALRRARGAPSLLLLVDYYGTRVPFAPTPELATPDAELILLLSNLAAGHGTALHLISGRQGSVLESW